MNSVHLKLIGISLFSVILVYSVLSVSTTPSSQVAAIAGSGSGLIGYYPFDDGSATDASGSGNNGIITGATSVPGKIVNALSFNGVDNKVVLTKDTLGSGPLSISAWIYAKSAGGNSNGSIVENRKTILSIDSYSRIDFSSNAAATAISAPGAVPFNSWHLVIVTRDASGTANIYVDGNLSGSANQSSGSPVAGATETAFGNTAGGGRAWDGYIDDVRIYDHVLQPQDITDLVETTQTSSSNTATTTNNPPPPPPPPQPSTGDVTASSCSTTDVQTALNMVATGYKVIVPAGTCTWTSGVTVLKNVTIQGAGKTSSLINLTGNGINAFNLGATASRVTGFGFTSAGDNNFVFASGEGFRVDHNKITNTDAQNRYLVTMIGLWVTGVVDHNDFTTAGILRLGDPTGSPTALASWQTPSSIGNPDQRGVLYVEDNTFTYPSSFPNPSALETNQGGRWVFRFNTVTNGVLGVHSLSGPNQRGSRSWEIYNNTFNLGTVIFSAFLRGGTGVVFNNAVTSSAPNNVNVISLDNERSFESNFPTPAGTCNGSSSWDGNTSGKNGWPCRDQIGRGMDNAGAFPQPQASEPAYFWNNTINGTQANPVVVNCSNNVKTGDSCADIVQGRDYFAAAVRPGYTPYTYPHPTILAQDGSSPISINLNAPPPQTYVPGDFNKDGRVNTVDYSDMCGAWNTSDPTYDLNKDGKVNTLDLTILVKNWSPP